MTLRICFIEGDSVQFDFGSNWQEFSDAKINEQRFRAAQQSLQALIGAETLEEKTFVDIGCGSGLFALAAASIGASRVAGFDVNKTSVTVSQKNLTRFQDHMRDKAVPKFCEGSILDGTFRERLGAFDVVYSWGVLHHTGQMWEAIRNAATLVAEDGVLVIAIYNKHWTAPIWRLIKVAYNLSPKPIRVAMHYVFGAVMYLGQWVTTGRNPLRKERGMDFWYDVIDWLGGYPYEYASVDEIVSFVEPLGFCVRRTHRTTGWTGCNEFVFVRT